MRRLLLFCITASAVVSASFAGQAVQSADTTGDCSPVVIDTAGDVDIDIACPLHLTPAQLGQLIDAVVGASGLDADVMEAFGQLSRQFGVQETALENFFEILERQAVPLEDLDHTLRQIARRHKQLLENLGQVRADDPEVAALKERALEAIEGGDYNAAEDLLRRAADLDLAAATPSPGCSGTSVRTRASTCT